MLLVAGPPRTLGAEPPARIRFGAERPSRVDSGEDPPVRIRFGEKRPVARAPVGRRLLLLDEEPAFELSRWCGTCQFLFRRLEGATSTCSIDAAAHHLAGGLRGIDDTVVTLFGSLLARGTYLPLLLTVEPRSVRPADPTDYFATEQVATWGIEPFWGLPEYPRTPYYRTFETGIDAGAHLFEFVVPMVPPSWNDAERVARYAADLTSGATPTAVAVSTLDVCAPAVDHGTDYYEHWALTHFLLDGHHKTQAAAESGRPLQLLSLLSVDASLASAKQVARIPDLRALPRAARRTRPR